MKVPDTAVRPLLSSMLAILCASLLAFSPAPALAASEESASLNRAQPSISLPKDFFTENVGQLNRSDVRFYQSSGSLQIGLADDAVLLNLAPRRPGAGKDKTRGVLVRMRFENANPVRPRGSGELSHRSNFFRGSQSSRWHRQVRSYKNVIYEDLYEGIDLSIRTAEKGIKYEFLVKPGADPGRIKVSYQGIKGLGLDQRGDLVVHTVLGDLRELAPYAYQGSQENETVPCTFVLRNGRTYGFDCGEWDASQPLVIDPDLVYSTFLGGGTPPGPDGGDMAWGIQADSDGNVYVAGQTWSVDFPTTPGAYDEDFNGGPEGIQNGDLFVAKLNAFGAALVYSTYLGGYGSEYQGPEGIALDDSGNVYVTGVTHASNFPTTEGAYNRSTPGPFVTKLNPDGSELVYSTFLPGASRWHITIDAAGNAYLVELDNWGDCPVTEGAYDTSYNGGGDVCVTKLNAAGTGVVYATYLGSRRRDRGFGIAIDDSGNAFVAGTAGWRDFPTTEGAYNRSAPGPFVTKLNADGSDLIYSTFLPGAGTESIAVDSAGNAYMAGVNGGGDCPVTPGAYDTSYNGYDDLCVTKLNAPGSALVYCTYLGGANYEYPWLLALDSAGNAYVTGKTGSADFPTTSDAFDSSFNGGGFDVFVSELNDTGSELVYSTFLGGSSDWDVGDGIAVDLAGNIYVAGLASCDLPVTPGAYDPFCDGIDDAFIAKFGSRPSCTTFPGCDDGNVCTTDACADGICENAPVEDDTACVSGICCYGSCREPVCTGDAACDDGDVCTDDSCVNPGTCSAFCENVFNPDIPGCGCIPTASKEKGKLCKDGIDNDCDGLIDGDDPDCQR
jgi:hypothetical protein